jgi:hypothetical protein
MKLKLQNLKLFALTLLAFFPTRLPTGVQEFETWAGSVLALATYIGNIPDNESTRFTLASMVPHQKSERAYISKMTFVNLIVKAAANQIAGNYMYEVKEAHKQRQAQEAANTVVVTAPDGAANGPQVT